LKKKQDEDLNLFLRLLSKELRNMPSRIKPQCEFWP
jgi:hypothetical protein